MLVLSVLLISVITAIKFRLPKHLNNDIVLPTYANFKLWQQTFEIDFTNDIERRKRFSIWRQNVKQNNLFNKQNHSWKRGVNQFSHLTFKEFESTRLMAPQTCSATEHNMRSKPYTITTKAPNSIDWRKERVISEVKDQGSCGSCWTFSTTGCLESHRAIYNSTISNFLIELSEQQLVECAGNFNNFGCNGGLPSQAFEYIRYNGGLNTEFSYPYTAGNKIVGNCKYSNIGWKVGGYVENVYNVTAYDENDMVKQVGNVGPLSVCFDVVNGFSQYKSGVYSSNTCGTNATSVNHAVLAVGYGIENGEDYWLVKNSWGFTWGDEGYFKIKRGSNECGISTCASYPILKETIQKFGK